MKLVRKELSPAEVANPALRYDEGCDCIQQTPDGGTTWVESPGLDVRHSEGARMPPLSGEDARCDAAARQAALWHETYDRFIDSTDAAQFASIVLQIALTLVGTGLGVVAGALLALFILVADALIAIGKSTMEAAFDDSVWDGVLCIIYCSIGEDGSVSAEQLADIYDGINAQYPGTVYNTLILIGQLFGEVLLSNASVERDETGDCTDCECAWCYHFDDTTGWGDWVSTFWNNSGCDTVAAYGSGAWQSGAAYQNSNCTGNFVSYVHLRYVFAEPVFITDAAVYCPSNPTNRQVYANGDGSVFSGTGIWSNGTWSGGAGVMCDSVDILCYMAVNNHTTFAVDAAQFSGVGDNPFGENNC